MTPDEVRALLAQLEGRLLPGAAEDLLARLEGDPDAPIEDWRIAVWGPLGVDGGAPMASVVDLAAAARVHSRPAAAAALALSAWHDSARGDGISDQAARVARAALLEDRQAGQDELAAEALADQPTVDCLARAWSRHVRAFLDSAELEPTRREVAQASWGGAPPVPWWLATNNAGRWLFYLNRSNPIVLNRSNPIDLESWLDDRDRDLPASTEAGVPWLSARLADYLRRELGEPGRVLAGGWLDRETERERDRLADELPYPGLPPRPALAGWTSAIPVEGLPHGRGVSAAALNLALAIWRAVIRPEVEDRWEREDRGVASALPLPLASARARLTTRVMVENGAVLSGPVPTGLSVAPGVDLATFQAVASTLHTLSARRAVAWLARVAWEAHLAGDRGTKGEGWQAIQQYDRSVLVAVEGGLAGLAAVLGLRAKDAGREVFRALEALAGVVLSAQTKPEAGLTGALIAQVTRTRGGPGRPGVVSCTLSPWWSPGAVHGLLQNTDRVIVPVLAPPPVDVLAACQQTHGAALEERALIELAVKAREVDRHGGVALRWNELAQGLGPDEVQRLLDHWRRQGRWLSKGDRWMLGTADPDLAAAATLIRQGGAMREARARGGQASVARKRGRRKTD